MQKSISALSLGNNPKLCKPTATHATRANWPLRCEIIVLAPHTITEALSLRCSFRSRHAFQTSKKYFFCFEGFHSFKKDIAVKSHPPRS
eukprot:7484561-Pyramimonas_sp.AAC.2